MTPFAPFPRLKPIALALLALFTATAPQANPRNPTVAAGQASFSESNGVLTVRNSPGAIINWRQFSIGAGETTRFIQQSASSSVLNRVTGQDPSRILGTLQSNGRVFLINPNGIVFGQGSRIDVASLVASTLNISDADFRAGKYRFQANKDADPGHIINQGTLGTGKQGNIYLIAPQIENSGIINAPNGQILLAAGRSVQLVDIGNPHLRIEVSAPEDRALNIGSLIAQGGEIGLYGSRLVNRGRISADSAIQGPGGKIVFKASGGNVTLDEGSRLSASGATGGSIAVQAENGDTLVHGVSLAATGSAGKGGDIMLTGQRVAIEGATAVDASGSTGGGNILVGGDYQGKNPAIQNAQETSVGAETRFKADATAFGDGGRIILWSDGTTTATGSYAVRGGPLGGNGGLIETSGKHLRYGANIDLAAPKGKAGAWLLDPANLIIDGGSGSILDTVYETDLEAVSTGTIYLTATDSITVGVQTFTGGLSLQTNVGLDIRTSGGVGDITLTSLPIQATGTGIITIDAAGSSGLLRTGNISAANQVKLSGSEVALSGTISGGNSVEIVARGTNGIHQDGPTTYNVSTSANGSIVLEADRIKIHDLSAYFGNINAGTNATVWLKPFTTGKAIALGTDSTTTGSTLNLGQNDTDRIIFTGTGTLKIGSTTSGPLSLTASMQIFDPDLSTLQLISGSNIDNPGNAFYLQGFNASPIPNLIAQAAGNVLLANSGNYFNSISGSSGGLFRYTQGPDFNVSAGGITAGTLFELTTTGGNLALNGIARGNGAGMLSRLSANNALTQNSGGGVVGNRVDLQASDVNFSTAPPANNVGTLSGNAGTNFVFSQQGNLAATDIGATTPPSGSLNLQSTGGALFLNNIHGNGNIVASAGGAGGVDVGSGGISLISALGSDIILNATSGPLVVASPAVINNSSPGGDIVLRAQGDMNLSAGSRLASTLGGAVDLATGAAGAIRGDSASLEATEIRLLAGAGINARTKDAGSLSARNTGNSNITITDTTQDPSNVSGNPLTISETTNHDGIVLKGLENNAPGSNVILKSERPIRIESTAGPVAVSANGRIELESKTQNAADSRIELLPGSNNVDISAPEITLRANDFGFYSGSGTARLTGTGATGFVRLSPSVSGGTIELWKGDPIGTATLAINAGLFSNIYSPYIGIGSDDAFVPSGNLLVSSPITRSDFNAGFLGLALMAASGTISQAPGATLSVPTLITRGGGSVQLTENNLVGKYSANHTGSASIAFRNAQNLDIGRVVPVVGPITEGITTGGGAITLNVTGNLLSSEASSGSRSEIDAGTGTGTVSVTATGGMALRRVAGSSVQMNAGTDIGGYPAGSRAKLAAGNLTVTAASGIRLDTDVAQISANGGSGNIDILEKNDIGIGLLNTTGNVRIVATGHILDQNASGTLNVTAANLDATGASVSLDTRLVTSARIEGTGTGTTNIVRLNDLGPQSAAPVPLQITALSAGNPIDISALRTIRVDASGPASGQIRIATANTAGAPASDIHTGLVKASGGTIRIASGGAITDTNDTTAAPAALNIDSKLLDMTAENGIGDGNPLEINVGQLAVDNKAGNVSLSNTGNLEILKANTGQTGTSNLAIDTTGTLTISGPITTGTGNIDLVATGDILQNANIATGDAGSILVKSSTGGLRMAAGTSTTSNGGTIDCEAEGDIVISQLSTGSTGSVAIRTLSGTIGTSTTGNNITTGNMVLAAAKGISGVGFAAKTASIGSTGGFVTVTNTTTGTVFSNDPALNPLPLEPSETASQQLSETLLASIDSLSPDANQNTMDLLTGGKKDEEENKNRKSTKEGERNNADSGKGKAGLPTCGAKG